MKKSELVLAIDIGGSKIVVALMNKTGELFNCEKYLLPKQYDAQFLTDFILKAVKPLLEQKPMAVGISVPGLTDSKTGTWKYAPFSGIAEFPIAKIISDATHLPAYAENDVNVCAIGERYYGICRDCDDFLWITVSNGVGGALFLNGRLYTGANGNAGEIGHITIKERGAVCDCGKRGCLEAIASGRAIARNYFEKTGERLSGQEIAVLAKGGDKTARSVFDCAGSALGKAIACSVNLLNFKKAIIGGGVADSFELLAPAMQKALDANRFKWAGERLIPQKTGLGYYASVIGAGTLAWKGLADKNI